MKSHKSATESAFPSGWIRFIQADVAELFDMSNISQARKLFYVYTILVLVTILLHSLKSFDETDQVGPDGGLNAEVARFIELGDQARDLY